MLAKGSMPVVAWPMAAFLLSLLLLIWNPFFALPFIIILGALAALAVNFFRDPDREIGKGVVSPADGVLNRAEISDSGAYFSIFMNIHNVHVNRAPWPGRVVEVVRMSGGHRPAYEKGAVKNERIRITMEGSLGAVTVTQMVGIVARRILPYVHAGDKLGKGERIGIIRLGSRVDLFVPSAGLRLVARKGDRVLAGTTTLARVVEGTDAQ
jgi:phosphatidylserine decarboxylase